MAKVAVVLCLAISTTIHGLTVSKDEPYIAVKDHITENTQHDSKPGSAVIKDWSKEPLFGGGEEWRGELGGQLLISLKAANVMSYCKRFVAVGNYTFCKQAMPKQSDGAAQSGYTEHEYTLPTSMSDKEAEDKPDSMLALSFGISQPDTWSDVLTKKYNVSTKQINKICLDNAADAECQTLASALQDREPHSTFVKLDVDGAEWGPLDWLAEHDDEIKKIRTLDVHFNIVKDTGLDQAEASSEKSMKQHVEVMKKLAKKFAVVGSTVEGSTVTSMVELQRDHSSYKEPLIHTQGGLPLEQFTASYMNWELL